MTTLEIITVNPNEYGIEENKASELFGNLPQIKAEREILSQQYDEVVRLDIEDAATSKKARELRLKIRDNRTKGIDVWHKTTKDFFLKGGQFVDAIKRQEVAVNERMEKNLEGIEKHLENIEKDRKAKLNAERISELEPYNAFLPIGFNFGELTDDEYKKVFNGAKLQFEHKQAEEKKAEEEIQRLAEIKKLHNERKESLLPVWQFVENKDINFGEMAVSEFSTIKENADFKKVEFDSEQLKIKAENERLAIEKKELEEKADKEKYRRNKLIPYITYIRDFDKVMSLSDSDFEKELTSLNNQAMDKMKFEAEENEKRENDKREFKAKKDAEAKAETERLAEEKRLKDESEALAKAPIKDQLNVWVTSFELPSANIENEKSYLIKEKFEAFKRWAYNEIKLM